MDDTTTNNSNNHNKSLDTSGGGSSSGIGHGEGDSALSGGDNHDGGGTNGRDVKRQQFTNKQRMDMYAFCVLELEMHSNKVSIKKQQQAIQRVLAEQLRAKYKVHDQQHLDSLTPAQRIQHLNMTSKQMHQEYQQQIERLGASANLLQPDLIQLSHHQATPMQTSNKTNETTNHQQGNQQRLTDQNLQENGVALQQQKGDGLEATNGNCNQVEEAGSNGCGNNNGNESVGDEAGVGGKTLLQLQQEVARTRKCYSDYQRTQVLTSAMLREVQQRFAKYYPDSTIPSRSTIKHVFEKCVSHGTVENIKTPRKPTKIPQGDEIEHLLIHEPQLSLRQLAQKLNVSTGTVSRRCKALGLIPESVTIKHQQLATARRQKQIKKLAGQSKSTGAASSKSNASNGNHEISTVRMEGVASFD